MAFTYHELKAKTIGELRDIAKGLEHEAVQGYTQLNKDHLLVSVCKALNIPFHEHHDAVGIDKAALKAKIRARKKDRRRPSRPATTRSSRRCGTRSTPEPPDQEAPGLGR